MVRLSDIRSKRRSVILRWVLPSIFVVLIIVGRLFFFVYKQPIPKGRSYHLMSRVAQPHRGDNVLLTLSSEDLAQWDNKRSIEGFNLKESRALLRVVGEPGDTLRFVKGELFVIGEHGKQSFIMPLPHTLQESTYEIILGSGEYWLLATSAHATETIDSRHLGPIHRTLISATVIW